MRISIAFSQIISSLMTDYFVATDIFGWRTRDAYVAAACLAADMAVKRRKTKCYITEMLFNLFYILKTHDERG